MLPSSEKPQKCLSKGKHQQKRAVKCMNTQNVVHAEYGCEHLAVLVTNQVMQAHQTTQGLIHKVKFF